MFNVQWLSPTFQPRNAHRHTHSCIHCQLTSTTLSRTACGSANKRSCAINLGSFVDREGRDYAAPDITTLDSPSINSTVPSMRRHCHRECFFPFETLRKTGEESFSSLERDPRTASNHLSWNSRINNGKNVYPAPAENRANRKNAGKARSATRRKLQEE